MNLIDQNYRELRKLVRMSSVIVPRHLFITYITHPHNTEKRTLAKDVCSFCGSDATITKEHILPRWTFENCERKFFVSQVNGLSQTYSRITVPACASCNNLLLSSIESYIIDLISTFNKENRGLFSDEIENLIRWLEIIEYKFQVLEVKRTFKASKTSGYLPFLANYPMTVMRDSINYSPYKAIAELRRSNKRLCIKAKRNRINSLVIFRMKEAKGFYFFHTLNEFIFLQLPQYKTAIFYFFEKEFPTNRKAFHAALKIIKSIEVSASWSQE